MKLTEFYYTAMLESNCCGAFPLWETDICSDCGEHAEFEEDN